MPISPEKNLRRENAKPSAGGNTPRSEALQGEGSPIAFSEEEWGRAQKRLILYMQFLKIPPFEVLELALEALKRARQSPELTAENPPITVALRTLRQLLLQRQPSYSGDGMPAAGLKQTVRQDPDVEDDDISRGVKSMPRLNRGTMLPKRSR